MDDLEVWLLPHLTTLNLDETVGSFLVSIVADADQDDEEKREAVSSYLNELTEQPTDNLVYELMEKWKSLHLKASKDEEESKRRAIEEAKERERQVLLEDAPTEADLQRAQAKPEESRADRRKREAEPLQRIAWLRRDPWVGGVHKAHPLP